ncbi:MAG: hypothetical protein K6F53_07215 [Lachnospiraceae bacterium]|nr:hypothetical protein [Lachnospiraceae bacterium]
MKKQFSLILYLAAALMLTGCEENSTSSKIAAQPASVKDVLEAEMAKEDDGTDVRKSGADEGAPTPEPDVRKSGADEGAPTPEPVSVKEPEKEAAGTEGIDVDLTVLSGTMVYSEVYNMMVTPEDYIGKTIKMEGTFSAFYDEETDQHYFACIIQDATACCSQGIEFILTDEYSYPDDYPEDGERICVAGEFDTYQEGEYTYCTLRNAKLI